MEQSCSCDDRGQKAKKGDATSLLAPSFLFLFILAPSPWDGWPTRQCESFPPWLLLTGIALRHIRKCASPSLSDFRFKHCRYSNRSLQVCLSPSLPPSLLPPSLPSSPPSPLLAFSFLRQSHTLVHTGLHLLVLSQRWRFTVVCHNTQLKYLKQYTLSPSLFVRDQIRALHRQVPFRGPHSCF